MKPKSCVLPCLFLWCMYCIAMHQIPFWEVNELCGGSRPARCRLCWMWQRWRCWGSSRTPGQCERPLRSSTVERPEAGRQPGPAWGSTDSPPSDTACRSMVRSCGGCRAGSGDTGTSRGGIPSRTWTPHRICQKEKLILPVDSGVKS